MKCNDFGGLYINSCHNCIIEGITWNECGTKNVSDSGNVDPVIQLCNYSNVIIKNCSFKNSGGKVVVLSAMVGNVSIDTCNFLFNKQYNGHGTALFYTSSNISNNSLLISDCVFFYNEGSNSIVYLEKSSPGYTSVCLENSKFHNNKGVPIYLRNQEFHIKGVNDFFHNKAENGGSIVISDYSLVIFHKNATVSFKSNRAYYNGGAIF